MGDIMGWWARGGAIASVVVAGGAAAAHPGHGAEESARHFLTDPFHLLVAALGLAAGASLMLLLRRAVRPAPGDGRRDG